jgi:hypothetical protein
VGLRDCLDILEIRKVSLALASVGTSIHSADGLVTISNTLFQILHCRNEILNIVNAYQ